MSTFDFLIIIEVNFTSILSFDVSIACSWQHMDLYTLTVAWHNS